MKQCFLKKTDKKSLDLVFLGYGQDEKPFQYLKDITPNSVALVYDYTDRDFDPSLYYEFEDINNERTTFAGVSGRKVQVTL